MYRYSKYIDRHLINATLLIAFSLTSIVWLTQALRFIDFIVNQGVSIMVFLQLTILLIPSLLMMILPPAFFCAVLFVYNKLKVDSELVVMQAAGLSKWRLAMPALQVAAVVTLITYAIAFYVQPTSYTKFRDMQSFLRNNYVSILLQEGVFSNPVEGLTVFLRERDKDGTLHGILVHDSRQPNSSITMIAEEGRLVETPQGPRFLLVNGNRQEMRQGKLSYLNFESYTLDISLYTQSMKERAPDPSEMSMAQLFADDDNVTPAEMLKRTSEAHQRILWPAYAVCLAMVAMASLLSGEFNRRGHWQRIAIGVAFGMLVLFCAIGLRGMSAAHASALPFAYLNLLIPAAIAAWFLTDHSGKTRHQPATSEGGVMKLPWTLSVYISRHFLLSILLALFGLVSITMLIDIVELIRRASGKDQVPFMAILEMTALKIPFLAEKMIPFAVLIGSMMALVRLTRTHELVVTRSAGISVWQFLAPAVAVVMTLGVFMTAIFNPIASVMLLKYEHIEGKYLTGRPSLLTISSSGLWLRQIETDMPNISEHIIYTMRVSQSDMAFSNIIIFTFDTAGKFIERLDAASARLEDGNLHLKDVTRSVPGMPPQILPDYRLPTSLTLSRIQDSFASPETMSFWHLPSFISMLENAGFSALRHRLYWHSLLAAPFLMAGTVLIAAVFSLRMPRRGRIGLLIVAGVVSGFLLHFFTDIIFAFGAAGTLPVLLAAWTPACVVMMAGTAMLLHLEDG